MKIAALFDLDGVLIDTEGRYSAFWASVGKDYFPDVEDFSERLKGQSLQHIYDEYFEGKEELREEIRHRLDAFEYTMIYVWVAGAKDFVKSLRRAGIGVAVVTSSNREKMKHLYDACPDFASLFDHILTAEDSSVSKPAPDCYLNAMRRMDVSAGHCVVFEDSFNGLRSGRASGAKVVGVSTSHPSEEISSLCDLVIPDFCGLMAEDLFTLTAG